MTTLEKFTLFPLKAMRGGWASDGKIAGKKREKKKEAWTLELEPQTLCTRTERTAPQRLRALCA